MLRTNLIFLVTVMAGLVLCMLQISSLVSVNTGEVFPDFDVVHSMVVASGDGVKLANTPRTDSTRTSPTTAQVLQQRPHHDNSSLTSYMWYQGKLYNPLEDERPPSKRSTPFVIDAVSVGTNFAVQQMKAQASSWASHWSMRYLFGATEDDDADPLCHEALTEQQYHKFFQTCFNKKYPESRLKGIRRNVPKVSFLLKCNKTKGWICAQQRFAHAVGKVGKFYQREGPNSLPDYLFIQDDDTFFGMNQLTSYLATKSRVDPFVTAGCLVEWPFRIANFSFPYGGFGLMLNRIAVQRLIKPIYCNSTSAIADPHTRLVCFRLQENLASEAMAFQEGMSISDLMDRHAAMHPYRHYEQWGDPGYCMMGDWILGYYVNYYELGSRENKVLDYIHIDKTLGYIYKEPLRTCLNYGETQCRNSRNPPYSCHRMGPEAMLEMHERDAQHQSSLLNGTNLL